MDTENEGTCDVGGWDAAYERAWPLPGAPGVRVVTDAADTTRAQALLDRHPDKADKIGTGILTFALVQMGTSSSGHLVIVHQDGTVSRLRHARPEVMKPRRARQLDSLRDVVGPQVRGARAALVASGKTTCERCGTAERLTADHYPTPFAQIAADWLGAHLEVELDAVPLTLQTARHVRSRARLTDRALETDWIRYHLARARYRVLCGPCNSHTAATSHPTVRIDLTGGDEPMRGSRSRKLASGSPLPGRRPAGELAPGPVTPYSPSGLCGLMKESVTATNATIPDDRSKPASSGPDSDPRSESAGLPRRRGAPDPSSRASDPPDDCGLMDPTADGCEHGAT